ncbi:hypothetical protein WR25_24823 [Diploscapter pachys]|uniref:Uncharacterized protein n=1 Tax=Diploscapter pachys TaxID=2018661 RepID=A0A2A2KK99_9BILA|nr:hypothetical protein WR25_24823 [Diploscapter pachys]
MGNSNTRVASEKRIRKNRRLSDTCIAQKRIVEDMGLPKQSGPLNIESHKIITHQTNSLKEVQSLSSSNCDLANPHNYNSLPDLIMRPLSRNSLHLPVKHMKTYSYRNMGSEGDALDKETCEIIRSSWNRVQRKLESQKTTFGVHVFKRILEKNREFRRIFGLREHECIQKLDENSPCLRHSRLFTACLALAVKNSEEFEAHVSPTIFKYGERHYTRALEPYMTEERIRFVCAQVVCSICDLTDDVQPEIVEAWIELMRKIGSKLLDGFEFAKLTAQNKISFKNTDSRLFLVL